MEHLVFNETKSDSKSNLAQRIKGNVGFLKSSKGDFFHGFHKVESVFLNAI